jgi:hypothetical protein
MSIAEKFFDVPNVDCRDENVKDFVVHKTTLQRVRPFVEQWHYSSNVNGLRVSHTFGLFCKNHLIGAMIYGSIGMANVWKKYATSEKDVVELRRLCCIDNTPRNTESYFIGKTIRWLKKHTAYKVIISYADMFHNHAGTIYKASNFQYHGITSPGRVIEYDGKIYHDKTIRTYNPSSMTLKPYAQKIKTALENGQAKYIDTPGKHIYVYKLR